MKVKIVKVLSAVLIAGFVVVNTPVFASDKAVSPPAIAPEKQTKSTMEAQPQVDKTTDDKTSEQRKKIMEEAHVAIAETQKALKALDEGKTEDAIKALELAIGKMELIVARDPKLALAKVDVNVKFIDFYANVDTLKKTINLAKKHLDDGEVQLARPLIASLASEMVIESVNIPLATYPNAIKAVVPLIDKGEVEKAKVAIQTALNTQVIVTEEVVPLPVARAKIMLKKAETLAEKKDRTEEEKKELTALLDDSRTQLKIAEILGYGKKKAFKPMYEQLDSIKEKTKDNKSGKGFFDKIHDQIFKLLD